MRNETLIGTCVSVGTRRDPGNASGRDDEQKIGAPRMATQRSRLDCRVAVTAWGAVNHVDYAQRPLARLES
jgi:hypothetical protein